MAKQDKGSNVINRAIWQNSHTKLSLRFSLQDQIRQYSTNTGTDVKRRPSFSVNSDTYVEQARALFSICSGFLTKDQGWNVLCTLNVFLDTCEGAQ
jgi:hypothetical protein